MTATTPTRIRCARRSTCWPGARRRPRWYWATWARSGHRGLNFIARSAAMPAAAASRACSRSAKRRRTPPKPSAKAPSISTTSRPWWRPSTRAPYSSKGRASCAWSGSWLRSPARPKERTDAARARAMARQGRARLQRVQLHHLARGARLPHSTRGVAGARSLHDPQAHRLQDRPGSTRRRAALAPHQGRDADHGRRADPGFDLRHDAPLGRSLEQVPVGGAAVTLAFGSIGWIDDYRKVVHRNPKGLSPKTKFFWQALIGLAAACYLGWLSQSMPPLNQLIVPFFKFVAYPLGTFGFIVLTFFVIVGTSNAVNLTDGLDGLAIMPTVLVGSALGIFAYVAGHAVFSKYLGLPYIAGAGELAVICGAMAGAGLGFLWFNAYPAGVFMGDVGALALGDLVGTLAVGVRQGIRV